MNTQGIAKSFSKRGNQGGNKRRSQMFTRRVGRILAFVVLTAMLTAGLYGTSQNGLGTPTVAEAAEPTATPTLTLAASPIGGQTRPSDVTLTAKLSADDIGIPNRSITFRNGSTSIGAVTTDENGVAVLVLPSPATGSYTFSASFAGDAEYEPANSAPIGGYTITRSLQASLAVTGLAANYIYGDGPVLVTAVGGSGTGAVTLASSNTNTASFGPVTAGEGLLTLNRAGSFTVTATKAQDEDYSGRSSSVFSVIRAATPVMTIARTDAGQPGDPAVFTVHVAKRGSGVTPIGTVAFFLNGVPFGAPAFVTPDGDGNGVAMVTLSLVGPIDNYTVRAEFSSDDTGRYNSASVEYTVRPTDKPQAPLVVDQAEAVSYGDAGFQFTASGGDGDGAVTWQLLSGEDVLAVDSDGYAEILAAGTVTVRAHKAASLGFTEIWSDTVEFVVAPRNLNDLDIQVLDEPFVYQATQIRPEVSASYQGGTTLTPIAGEDFVLVYGANISAGAQGGVITLNATSSNYTGTRTLQFAIEKAPASLTLQALVDNEAANSGRLPFALSLEATFIGVGGDVSGKNLYFENQAGLELGGLVSSDTGGSARSHTVLSPSVGSYSFAVQFDGNTNYLPASAALFDFEVTAAAAPTTECAVVALIRALPNPVQNYADADLVAAVTNLVALTNPNECVIPQEAIDQLQEAQHQAGDVDHHTKDGEADGGGERVLPWYVRLEIVLVPETDGRFPEFADELTGGYRLLELYEVHFVNTLTHEQWQPASGDHIEIRLTHPAFAGFHDLAVVHELPDHHVELVPSLFYQSGVEFSGSSFSLYGIEGLANVATAQRGGLSRTGDDSTSLIAAIGLLAVLAGSGTLVQRIVSSRRRR